MPKKYSYIVFQDDKAIDITDSISKVRKVLTQFPVPIISSGLIGSSLRKTGSYCLDKYNVTVLRYHHWQSVEFNKGDLELNFKE